MGFFWWSLVASACPAEINLLTPDSLHQLNASMAAYFFMWGIFTFAMFFGTLKANRALQFVFLSLAILFFMLTTRELTRQPSYGSTLSLELKALYVAEAQSTLALQKF